LLSDHHVSGNYGHMLLDCFSRLHLLQAAGLRLGDMRHVILPGPENEWCISLAESLGVKRRQMLFGSGFGLIQADELYATSFPGLRRNYPPWVPQFLRKALPTKACPAPRKRRLYVQRLGTRKIINEAAVVELLENWGFEIYEPESSQQQFQDFRDAEAVIGCHGAGLTNIVFCEPGTPVIEMIPSDHIQPYYYTLAASSSLKYHYICVSSEQHRPEGSFGPSPYDVEVKLEDLDRILELALGKRPDGLLENAGVLSPNHVCS